jgi:hypothetical protein
MARQVPDGRDDRLAAAQNDLDAWRAWAQRWRLIRTLARTVTHRRFQPMSVMD